MGTKTLRVDIPRSAEEKGSLAGDVVERHQELGANSPLINTDVDMTSFAVQVTEAGNLRIEAESSNAQAQAATQAADTALGVAVLQTIDTAGTVYFYIGRFRKQLLLFYEGLEEELSRFGFVVIISGTGARKNVRVEIPRKKRVALEQLAVIILARHAEMGNNSPLKSADVSAFSALLQTYNNKRKESKKFHAKSQAAMMRFNVLIGMSKGQTVRTKGTIYYILNRIRTLLVLAYQGVEEEISTFGFNVVVGERRSHRPSPPLPPGTVYISAFVHPAEPNTTVTFKLAAKNATGNEAIMTRWDATGRSSIVRLPANHEFITMSRVLNTAQRHELIISGQLQGIGTIDMQGFYLTSIVLPQGLNPTHIVLGSNPLTSLVIPAGYTDIIHFDAGYCLLDVTSINHILSTIESYGTSDGTLILHGGSNGAPTGTGIAAKEALMERGWNVTVN